jgi:hypothetical protein
MTMRRKWAVVPGLLALVAAAVMLSASQSAPNQQNQQQQPARINTTAQAGPWGYSAASSDQGRSPDQPIAFPHPVHVQVLGMNCLYCHFAANKSPDPGMPALNTCMGCHELLVGPQRPASVTGPARRSEAIATLQQYWKDRKPVPWVRIHKVPDYVNFPHMRHVNAGVTCQTCHGDVQNMQKVFQYASLNMGWCVSCHVNGYTPPTDAPPGLEAIAATVVPPRDVPPTTADTSHGVPVGMTGYPRRARYDCSVCHY